MRWHSFIIDYNLLDRLWVADEFVQPHSSMFKAAFDYSEELVVGLLPPGGVEPPYMGFSLST